MSCLLFLCLSGLYIEGGIGYDTTKPRTESMQYYNQYRRFDANETPNPRGNLAIGHEWSPTPKWRTSLELRHESWIGTPKDHGLNGAWISVRYRPFARSP